MLHRYRHLYSLNKNKRHLLRHCTDVGTRFDTSKYELDKPSKGKKVK